MTKRRENSDFPNFVLVHRGTSYCFFHETHKAIGVTM